MTALSALRPIRRPAIGLATPLVAALALSVGACTGATNMDNRSLYSVKQPVVERSTFVFEVDTNGDGLPIAERQRLANWFESLDVGYGDRVAIDDPSGSHGVRDDVAVLASRYGLLVADAPPVLAGALAPGRARIVITRSVASVPGCPDWSHTSDVNYANATNPNYGCATNGNIAAMIADPEDLIQGKKGTGETVVLTSTKAISAYRDADPTGTGELTEVPTTGGN